MTQHDSNHDSSNYRLASEHVFEYFEEQWRKQQDFQIEHLLKSLKSLVKPFGIDATAPEFLEPLLAELIKIEMDLHREADQKIDRFKYYRRFPDFVTIVDEALARIDDINKDENEFVRTISMPSDDDRDEAIDIVVVEDGKEDIPTELGHFREIVEIGSGGFGVVCKAIDIRDGKKVALKFPRKKVLKQSSLLKLFLEEAERVINLDHPGIVKTFAIEHIDDYMVIVQELVIGADLKESTKTNSRSHQEIAELVAQIADALAVAHLNGIVHRDLKPSNILLDQDGRPYIADFGMALDERSQLSAPNVRCGSPPWMSPQLVAGLTKNLDGRTDIWSLGVILYELLVGRRPFRGLTENDIYQQIEERDPKPLRQLDPTVPKELQRICLKCLEKKAKDRYLSGDELADDLRHWIASGDAPEHPIPPDAVFVPKGLRSYDAADSAFFLDLLPGPRDRENIPSSIGFWRSRICEPVPAENRVPVGVIYGPSGSGKSSFIKAGLLPQVNHGVETVYVESTQADTEVRMIKALRNRFPDISDDISLPELFRGLSLGQWQTSDNKAAPKTNKKILIVLDQFEQRLSQADDYDQSQLARALRHCDGEQLQCLLLIRDDFWLALTRFCDALEMDLLEGQNSQAIDLFDRDHARKVLIKLGRAYDCLPAETEELSKEQNKFLDQAIDQLAVGNYVICVRLTLFAEMFKSRPWTVAELKSVGGAHGVGERFLEETFGKGSTSKRYQSQNESVKAVLEVLLPNSGSDIRGSMRSENELINAAKLEKRPIKFKELIKTLDQELRLITRTDPDIGEFEDSLTEGTEKLSAHFQLTHDYLVPSIRNWLRTEQWKTRKGRARIRLNELASYVVSGQKPKNKPTNMEWITWQYHFFGEQLNEQQLAVMRSGRRQFLLAVGGIGALAAGVIPLGIYLDRRNRIARTLVSNIIGQEFEKLIDNVSEIERLDDAGQNSVKRLLEDLFKNPGSDAQRRKSTLALVRFKPERDDLDESGNRSVSGNVSGNEQDDVIKNITRSDCGPIELEVSVQVLTRFDKDRCKRHFDSLQNIDKDSKECQLRAMAAASQLWSLNAKTFEWKVDNWDSGTICSAFLLEDTKNHTEWIRLLRPIGNTLNAEFQRQFESSSDDEDTLALANAIYSFSFNDPLRASEFVQLLLNSNDAQFHAILSTFESNDDKRTLLNAINAENERADDIAIATKSVALLRLGESTNFQQLLGDLDAPGLRSYAIILANSKRISFDVLRNLTDHVLELSPPDDYLRQGVLMALAEYSHSIYDNNHLLWLTKTAQNVCLTDADPGCFAVAELIARRLAARANDKAGLDHMKWRKKRTADPSCIRGVLGNVFINSQNMAFAIISPTKKNKLLNSIAVSLTELTLQEWKNLNPFFSFEGRSGKEPFVITNLANVFAYCDNLSKRDGIPDDEWIYGHRLKQNMDLLQPNTQKLGYRLLTFDEWFVVSNTNSKGTTLLGPSNILSRKFAWSAGSRKGEINDVGELLPNRYGLFDVFGNTYEPCTRIDEPRLLGVGGHIRDYQEKLSSESKFKFTSSVLSQGFIPVGIRLVKTLPKN